MNGEELREMRVLLGDYMTGLVLRMAGPVGAGLTAEQTLEMVQRGIVTPSEIPEAGGPLGEAYAYGHLTRHLEAQGVSVNAMNLAEFRQYLGTMPPILTAIEEQSIQAANQFAGVYCQGLGNRLVDEILSETNLEDMELRERMVRTIATETEEAIAQRETVRQLSSRYGHATQDWARNWERIAATEMHRAREHGYADSVEKDFGAHARVAKVPEPGACPSCLKHYTDDSGLPTIFDLSELRANGTNVGVKQPNWRPTLGPLHPWCRCSLAAVPDGFAFNEEHILMPEGAE